MRMGTPKLAAICSLWASKLYIATVIYMCDIFDHEGFFEGMATYDDIADVELVFKLKEYNIGIIDHWTHTRSLYAKSLSTSSQPMYYFPKKRKFQLAS